MEPHARAKAALAALSNGSISEAALRRLLDRGIDRGRFELDRHPALDYQPLPWLDGRYQLIFNGEIYKYLELRERLAREFGALFDTDGDGEAVVAGYHYLGEKIVRELRGMFSFLIWDAQDRVLFGARDWFGIKPLYTYTDERGSFFSSEKKSLLDVAAPGTSAGRGAPWRSRRSRRSPASRRPSGRRRPRAAARPPPPRESAR